MSTDPILAAMRSAISAAAEINEASAWLMADRILRHLDAGGYRVVAALIPTLHAGRTLSIDLATYQNILGERNALRARLAEANGQLAAYRDQVDADPDPLDCTTGVTA